MSKMRYGHPIGGGVGCAVAGPGGWATTQLWTGNQRRGSPLTNTIGATDLICRVGDTATMIRGVLETAAESLGDILTRRLGLLADDLDDVGDAIADAVA